MSKKSEKTLKNKGSPPTRIEQGITVLEMKYETTIFVVVPPDTTNPREFRVKTKDPEEVVRLMKKLLAKKIKRLGENSLCFVFTYVEKIIAKVKDRNGKTKNLSDDDPDIWKETYLYNFGKIPADKVKEFADNSSHIGLKNYLLHVLQIAKADPSMEFTTDTEGRLGVFSKPEFLKEIPADQALDLLNKMVNSYNMSAAAMEIDEENEQKIDSGTPESVPDDTNKDDKEPIN